MEAGYSTESIGEVVPPKKSQASLIMAATIFLSLLMGISLSLLFSDPILGVLTGISLALSIFPFLLFKREESIFAPPYVLSILLFISYPLRLILITFFREYADIDQHTRLYLQNVELMRQAMGLIVIGQLGFLFGYYRPPGVFITIWKKLTHNFSGDMNRIARKAFFLSYGIWAIQVFRKISGSGASFISQGANYSAGTNQIFSWTGDLSLFAASLAVVWLAGTQQKKGIDILLAILALIPSFLQPLIIEPGGKTPLLSIVFVIVASIVLTGRKMRLSYALISLSYLILFVWPFVSSYRDLVVARGTNRNVSLTISQQAELTVVALDRAYQEKEFDDLIGDFSRRFGAFDATMVTLARVPQRMNHTYFKDLILVPFILVPRIIFPIKPISTTQSDYSVRVYGMTSGGSAAPFIVGEGYLNGGVFGVPLLAWAWGIMWATFYRGFLYPRRKEMVAVALYVALLTRFATSFEWALMSMIGLPSFLVLWAPAVYWCTLRSKKKN